MDSANWTQASRVILIQECMLTLEDRPSATDYKRQLADIHGFVRQLELDLGDQPNRIRDWSGCILAVLLHAPAGRKFTREHKSLGNIMLGVPDAAYQQWILRLDLHGIAMYGRGLAPIENEIADQNAIQPDNVFVTQHKIGVGNRTQRGGWNTSPLRVRRLREARLARGLYKSALADMIGITGTAITRYEDGIDKPQQDRLGALAKHLNFPIEFFLQPEWPDEPAVVHWRSRAAETKYAREMTEQRMIWLCEIFAFLERDVNFPVVGIPDLALPDFRSITPDMIERAVEDIRAHWKLRDLPIPDVLLALENAGVPVCNLEIMSEKQDGFCFCSPKLNRTFVGINTHNVSAARARYDAAHELGHIVLHKHVTPQQIRDPVLHKKLEQQAHRFAGAFLFPRTAFRAEVSVPSLDYFCALKKRWGISIAAMVHRAFDVGLIDDLEMTALYRNMARRRWRGVLQEPFDSSEEMRLERPRMLRRGMDVLLNDGHMRSSIRAALALPLSRRSNSLRDWKRDFSSLPRLCSLPLQSAIR